MALVDTIFTELDAVRESIRAMMEQCLACGNYAELAELASLAEAIEGLRREERGKPVHRPDPHPVQGQAVTLKQPRSAKRSRKEWYTTEPTQPQASSAPYPLFVRDGDKLVKIAWSAKDKKEYEHRAPRSAISSLIDVIASKASSGKLFHVDGILPVPDDDGSGELPTYQVYLVLAWLRECGVIEKVGRDQYKLLDAAQAHKTAKRCWTELVSK